MWVGGTRDGREPRVTGLDRGHQEVSETPKPQLISYAGGCSTGLLCSNASNRTTVGCEVNVVSRSQCH